MTVSAPVSCAITSCVRSAIEAASADGSARTSSSALVWSDCVPPSTAASASIAVRTTLFMGCWAVSETPAVWVWNFSCIAFGFVAPNRSFIHRAQMRRAARNLAISSKKSMCASKKNDSIGPEVVGRDPSLLRQLDVGEPVGQRERELLRGRRARLTDVVTRRPTRGGTSASRARRTRTGRPSASDAARAGTPTPSARCTP